MAPCFFWMPRIDIRQKRVFRIKIFLPISSHALLTIFPPHWVPVPVKTKIYRHLKTVTTLNTGPDAIGNGGNRERSRTKDGRRSVSCAGATNVMLEATREDARGYKIMLALLALGLYDTHFHCRMVVRSYMHLKCSTWKAMKSLVAVKPKLESSPINDHTRGKSLSEHSSST